MRRSLHDMPSGFDLVIAAPEHDAGMIAQALDLLNRFLADILLKRKIAGHHVAAKHELLPDHQAKFVANVVEVVALVNSATPLAHHVHVRVACSLQDLAMALRR